MGQQRADRCGQPADPQLSGHRSGEVGGGDRVKVPVREVLGVPAVDESEDRARFVVQQRVDHAGRDAAVPVLGQHDQ